MHGAYPDKDTHNWAAIAREDLEAARRHLRGAHPAQLLDDARFHAWMEEGYFEALNFAESACNARQAQACVARFLRGFRDPHLHLVASGGSNGWLGWTVRPQGGALIVRDVAEDWPQALPPIGARLLRCDDEAPDLLMQERIAPYVDMRLELEACRQTLSALLSNRAAFAPLPRLLDFQYARFALPDGSEASYATSWQITDEGLRRAFPRCARTGISRLTPNMTWARLPDFGIAPDDPDFEAVLLAVSQRHAKEHVVLDLRGNEGGHGLLVARLLAALRIPQQELVRDHADWRVSELAATSLKTYVETLPQMGKDEASLRVLRDFSKQMRRALAAGEPWLRQTFHFDALSSAAPATACAQGRIVVLTDARCTSSALDLVEAVREDPRGLHIGQETNADTRYTDVTTANLPSGLRMLVPLKVWNWSPPRDRVALRPHHAFGGDIRDTSSVQTWLFALLQAGSGALDR